MPHSTTCVRPRLAKSSRSASISPTSGRDERGSPTHESRTRDSDSASGPHSVASWAKSLPATPSATSTGTWREIASAAAPEALTDSELTRDTFDISAVTPSSSSPHAFSNLSTPSSSSSSTTSV